MRIALGAVLLFVGGVLGYALLSFLLARPHVPARGLGPTWRRATRRRNGSIRRPTR